MTSDTTSSRPEGAPITPPASPDASVPPPTKPEAAVPPPKARETTRAAGAWFATTAALVLLVLLIILILQNQDNATVHYLGFSGSIPLGTALLVAAVAGAAVVATVGVVRLTQLRVNGRRARRLEVKRAKKP